MSVLDAPIRRVIEPPLAWAARFLARWGLSAYGVTIAGFVVGMASLGAEIAPLVPPSAVRPQY